MAVVSLAALKKMSFGRKKVVLIGGGFDLLHIGHFEYLKRAKSLGDILIVHITGDKRFFVKRGKRPIFKAKERAMMLDSVKGVDYVFPYEGRHYDQKVVDAVRPAILSFHKESWEFAKDYVYKELRFSGEVIIMKTKKHSSTAIKERIRNGD